jgi:hypothetical protein
MTDVGRVRFVVTPVRPLDPGAVVPRAQRGAVAVPRPVYWRLLSRNNRQLGRSPAAFRCAADAVAAAERVGKARYELEPRLVRLVDPVRWLWTTALDGLPAAVSGRSYERERVAAHALEQFLGGVSDALGSRASTP